MIRTVLLGAAGAALSIGLAVPANAAAPDFVAAARADGITGTDPGMIADGYDVCYKLWNQHVEGTQVAAGLVHDHPTLTSDQAAHFVLAAYDHLCPQPGEYDYWAYSTS